MKNKVIYREIKLRLREITYQEIKLGDIRKYQLIDTLIVSRKGIITNLLCSRNSIISSTSITIQAGNPKLVTITNPYGNGNRKACHQ